MSFFNADIRVTGNDGLILKDLGAHATTPGSGLGTLYYNGGTVYIQNAGGTTTSLSGGGGGGSTAADDITVGDSTVNISTTSGSIIMHSVNNASNSIVMTSNSGVSETIEVHNILGTNSSAILLKSYKGGTTFEGRSTNIDNDPNRLAVSRSTPTSNGSGFAPMYFNSFITEAFGTKVTTFQIDAQNLVVASKASSSTVCSVGKNNSSSSFFGINETSSMGTIYKMEMFCLEAPSPNIGTSEDIGFLDWSGFGDGNPFNLSNGTTYTITGGISSQNDATVTFDMTTNGGIKEIFVNNAGTITGGSGYVDSEPVDVTGDDSTVYTFNYYTADRRVVMDTNTFKNTLSDNTNISTEFNPSTANDPTGLTVDLKQIYDSGMALYPIYGVSVNTSGSGYSTGDKVENQSSAFFRVIYVAPGLNKYTIGYSSNVLSTGETDITNLSTASEVSLLSEINLSVPTTLSTNDYFYLTYTGVNSSNVSLTAGKFLIKMHGASF